MAQQIINTLPQPVDAAWTRADGTPGTPDSVDWSVSDPTLGAIAPDPANPTGRAIFTPNAGALGDVTVNALAHQAGLPDVQAAPLTGTLVNPTPPPNPIVSGVLTFEPQSGSPTPAPSPAPAPVAAPAVATHPDPSVRGVR